MEGEENQSLTYDPHPPMNIVPLNNVNKIDGLKLEEIPEIAPGYAPGYAVVVKDFETMLIKKREGLGKAELYRMARILAKENGVNLPE